MNDDLDEEIIGSEQGFDEFVQKSSLGDMVRSNPMAKVGIILGAVAVVVAIAVYFGSKEQATMPSAVQEGSDVNSPPATDDATPAYVAAVNQKNEENLETAIKEGGSTLPVPVESNETRLNVPVQEEEAEDPLHRWRRLQEETVARDLQSREAVEAVTVLDSEQQGEALKALAESMSAQMESILGSNDAERRFEYKGLVKYTEKKDGADAAAKDAAGGGAGGDAFAEDAERDIIIPAGEIEYAQTLLEANSDVPGPVLVTLLSGKLKGSRLIGTFSVQDDYLTLSFSRIVVDGVDFSINAIAIDPETSLPGMATDVDHRYFRRIVLPAAAAFVEGFASAVAESGRTDVTVTGETVTEETQAASSDQKVATGVEEAGQEVRSILDKMGDVKTLVKIKAGTPIGILFTEAVEKPEEKI